ncbi:MAG: hypothetical protein SPL80_08430 [Bacilli bacterium]|nr:hypothetical protein [Bacilli bacterium]
MQLKKDVIFLLTSTMVIGAFASVALLSNDFDHPSFLNAESEPYTLTIDASNRSNFVQDGDVYRGVFKTGLGNDVTFVTNSVNPIGEDVFYWQTNNGYLKNETAMTGLYQIDISAYVYGGALQNPSAATLRTETRIDPKQASSVYSADKMIDARSVQTYSINIPSNQSHGNYISMKLNENIQYASRLEVTSVKFYFSCSNVKNLVKVSSTNESYGTVSIEGYGSNEQIVTNGTQVTIHANPLTNYQTEFFASFKGWHLNGSEEIVSRDFDITFTTESNKSYVYTAEFEEAEAELFNQGVDTSGDNLTTYVKNKNNKYYPLNSVKDDNTSYPTALTGKVNELFIAQHFSRENYLTHLELNIDRKGHGNWEPFDPDKIQAVIFYMNMDQSTQSAVGIDQFVTTNGTLTTYSGLKDETDKNKAMSKVVWTNFTSDVAKFYVPDKYRDPNNIIKHNIWIKRMLVIER